MIRSKPEMSPPGFGVARSGVGWPCSHTEPPGIVLCAQLAHLIQGLLHGSSREQLSLYHLYQRHCPLNLLTSIPATPFCHQGGEKMAYDIRSPLSNKSYGEASLVIIGSGISGICLAIDLIRHHGYRNFVILEKSTGIGGTWRDNRYPGCCCDGRRPNGDLHAF